MNGFSCCGLLEHDGASVEEESAAFDCGSVERVADDGHSETFLVC